MKTLEIRYEPLNEVYEKIYAKNPKEHDIGAIYQSILKHGFREPAVFDETLKAIIAGNGRVEALWLLYRDWCAELFTDVPEGIKINESEMWEIPVLYGINAKNYKQAVAYLIDTNNLTMAGGTLTALDMSRAWDMEEYLVLLGDALGETLTVDEADYNLLYQLAKGVGVEEPPDDDPPSEKTQDGYYYLKIAFLNKDDYNEALATVQEIAKNDQGDWFLGLL